MKIERKMIKRTVLCIIFMGMVRLPSSGAELHGVVYDHASMPMSAVMIGIAPILEDGDIGQIMESATSDTGQFSFTDLEMGKYMLYGPGEGYLASTIELRETSVVSNVVMHPQSKVQPLTVRILEWPVDSEPLCVRLFPGDSTAMSFYNVLGESKEDSIPVYVYSNLYEGSYRLSIRDAANRGASCILQLSAETNPIGISESYGTLGKLIVEIWLGEGEHGRTVWTSP